jgi:lipoyl-dependent peroxiredoxin subunit D
MNLNSAIEKIGDYGKDTKLNLRNVLTVDGAPGLTLNQILGTALACAYTTGESELVAALRAESEAHLSPEEVKAAQAASTLMAMNNVYYRTLHLAERRELAQIPAKLRMTFLGNPGIPKATFELYCLAVSAQAGCGKCVNAHVEELLKASVPLEGIHSGIRIAAVVQSAAQAMKIGRM